MTRLILASLALLALAACARKAAEDAAPEAPAAQSAAAMSPIIPVATDAPAGTYILDKAHASLVFTVDHLGFSNYTGQFKSFDATLGFDPANPAAMRVRASVDPLSLDIPAPPGGFLAELTGPQWLDAGQFATMVFTSTKVELTGPDTATVEGDLAFHGVTAPVALDAKFNGGFKSLPPHQTNARIGFSASGSLSRSAFGVSYGVPPPGSTMGVGDAVAFTIEAEFTGPPME